MQNNTEESTLAMEYENIAIRIKHILSIWPILSPTLLQASLGPQTKPELWRPVLEELIASGVVVQETMAKLSPSKRYIDYQRL